MPDAYPAPEAVPDLMPGPDHPPVPPPRPRLVPVPELDPEVENLEPTRLCGRCRGEFPADPSREPLALGDWWLCEPCRLSLMGPGRSTPRIGP